MSRYGYVSGWCSPGARTHGQCAGQYGHPERRAACTCRCHRAAAAQVTDQLDLFATDRREMLTPA
jgi:hypothetical protein